MANPHRFKLNCTQLSEKSLTTIIKPALTLGAGFFMNCGLRTSKPGMFVDLPYTCSLHLRRMTTKQHNQVAMQPQFYNTLTNTVEAFEPVDSPVVNMYNCGPTVYDYAHIGNFRAFVFSDVLRRALELLGYQVNQVMNITDVGHMTEDDLADGGGEDKMDVAAQRIAAAKKAGDAHVAAIDDPSDPYQIARFYADAFVADAKQLGVKVAFDYDHDASKTRMPHATDHVAGGMIPLIETLIEKGNAYVASDGAVYFDVQSFPAYGKLSGNTLDKLRGGAGGRLDDAHQAVKKTPADFLLWKPDSKHLMKWPSPWGEGYPGWHIECSAMARSLLGKDVIDIHTGGEDNIFPHHECEIAQSCCATGESHFAKLWMHTRFLLVEGEKMSKSKGNFFTVRDVLEGRVTGRPVDPAVLRYELLKSHYRNNANFTKKGLEDSASAVDRFRKAVEKARGGQIAATDGDVDVDLEHPMVKAFAQALADDLNMSAALAQVFGRLNDLGEDAESLQALLAINSVLNILPSGDTSSGGDSDADATGASESTEALCKEIDAARANKDFETADAVRQQLTDAGYEVTTTKEGTIARKKLA